MTNYEAIKDMNIEEMAAIFYMFIKPFMDAFELSEDQKRAMRESVMAFLETEVKAHEDRRSQAKP